MIQAKQWTEENKTMSRDHLGIAKSYGLDSIRKEKGGGQNKEEYHQSQYPDYATDTCEDDMVKANVALWRKSKQVFVPALTGMHLKGGHWSGKEGPLA